MGNPRMVFPGGNTCRGFFSFYDYIVGPDATRLYVIKGGPGVGKSTFMKNLGEEFLAEGLNVEYHWCSSDNDSLDALVLPDCRIAVLDGTSPHIVDPRIPGAVDEIINFGECWDEKRLVAARKEITGLVDLVGRYFRLAYMRLREARAIWDEWCEYYKDTVPPRFIHEIIRSLQVEIANLFTDIKPPATWVRHLFAAALTPRGVATHAGTLFDREYKIVALCGRPGTGVTAVLPALLSWAEIEELPVEVYHNPFDPAMIDILIFPEAQLALLDNSSTIVDYRPCLQQMSNVRFINVNQLVDRFRLIKWSQEIEDAEDRFSTAMEGAIGFIHLAKRLHDEMEDYYIPAMNFDRIESTRLQVKQRILSYAARSGQSQHMV